MGFKEDYSKYFETTDLYPLFTDEMPFAVVILSREGTILHINKTMLEFTGYTYNEVISRDYLSLFVPQEDWNRCWFIFKKHNNAPGANEKVFNVNRVIAKDGKIYVLEWYGCNIADASGEVVFSLGFGIDITERHNYVVEFEKAFHEIETLKNELTRENNVLKRRIKDGSLKKIIGNSENIKDILQRIMVLADTDATVLILGETGTGKELIAEALHDTSIRNAKPLVKVNCPAMPETLFESELFGHVKGAFSGAVSNKIGRIQAAEGGTLVLDEIGEISLTTQVKLLRFLESKEYECVGDTKTRLADVRLIASTNADLEKLVGEGRFRADLLYRLRVTTLTLPALRERKSDLKVLINDFLGYYNNLLSKRVLFPDMQTIELLQNYDWPGNVRELRHVIEHACIYCPKSHIRPEHLPEHLAKITPKKASRTNRYNGQIGKEQVLTILDKCRWNKKGAVLD